MTKDALSVRMKSYEAKSRSYLERHTPVIIRIDGKSFHTFTKGFVKPFDDVLIKAMQSTMKYLCENIQGCVFGYTQNDEISLVLTDYAEPTTDAWFDNNLQKMCSISASMATMAFNKYFSEIVMQLESDVAQEYETDGDTEWVIKMEKYLKAYRISCENGAMFDARVFTIPKEEVCNYFIWRQQDAVRNSILSVGQANYSHKDLHGKSCNEVCNMLLEKNINWEELSDSCKYGSACYKKDTICSVNSKTHEQIIRKKWYLDLCIPNFCKDKQFIEQWL